MKVQGIIIIVFMVAGMLSLLGELAEGIDTESNIFAIAYGIWIIWWISKKLDK